jgi:hypothetical protein
MAVGLLGKKMLHAAFLAASGPLAATAALAARWHSSRVT